MNIHVRTACEAKVFEKKDVAVAVIGNIHLLVLAFTVFFVLFFLYLLQSVFSVLVLTSKYFAKQTFV